MKKKIIVVLAVLLLIVGVFGYKKLFIKDKSIAQNNNKVTSKINKNIIKDEKNDIQNNNLSENKEKLDADDSISMANLISKGKPFIIEFSLETCAPCRMLHPILEKAYRKYGDKIIIKSVDLEKLEKFSNDFPVRVTPTIFYFNSDGSPFEFSQNLSKKINYVGYKDRTSEKLQYSGTEGFMEYDTLSSIIEEMINDK